MRSRALICDNVILNFYSELKLFFFVKLVKVYKTALLYAIVYFHIHTYIGQFIYDNVFVENGKFSER